MAHSAAAQEASENHPTSHVPTVVDPSRTGVRGAIVAGGVILVIAALVFTNAFAAEQAVVDGIVGQRAQAALGANDIALKALAQAVLLAEDRALGVADDDTVQKAIDEAATTLIELDESVFDLDEALGGSTVYVELAGIATTTGGEVIVLAAAGDVEDAAALLAGPMKDQLEVLRDLLSVERADSEAALTSLGSVAGTLANIAIFFAAFLLPLAAILAYRFAARRQLRVAEIQLDTRLAAEHEVIRAKDEFIANMSHELRTPLTSIYGFSEMLLETGVVDPDSAMDLIGMINHESSELGRMVEDLLVSARAEAGALVYSTQPVSVRKEVAAVLGPIAREGTEITVDVEDAAIGADPLRFRQIVRNLVSNAIRHGGGTIRVEGGAGGDSFTLVVADNGSGVPASKETRLFTRFVHEGDEALTVGSVGLGLAVVKALAEGMDGSVAYERTGGWTRFVIVLPLAPRSPSLDEAAQPLGDLSPVTSAGFRNEPQPTGLRDPRPDDGA